MGRILQVKGIARVKVCMGDTAYGICSSSSLLLKLYQVMLSVGHCPRGWEYIGEQHRHGFYV